MKELFNGKPETLGIFLVSWMRSRLDAGLIDSLAEICCAASRIAVHLFISLLG